MDKKKVMIGMSGGVDSSVAALLLRDMGYDVAGVTFKLWPPDGSAEDDPNVRDARIVCERLGIPHYVMDFRDSFRKNVVDYFLKEYDAGHTPNPCVACNRTIKFGAFMEEAKKMGYDYVATGHYAKVEWKEDWGKYVLRPGKIEKKDQSYVLYMLTQEQLAHIVMPIGDYAKDEVREIARKNNLLVADKPDSQDICFIPDGDHTSFLQGYAGRNGAAGNFVDSTGKILGPHQGIWKYTVGQRKGLGLSLNSPAFVCRIKADTGDVVLTQDPSDLMSRDVRIRNVSWQMGEVPAQPVVWNVKIRYAHHASRAVVTPLENNEAAIRFDMPQRAATPGQTAVFYTEEGIMMGGGTIL